MKLEFHPLTRECWRDFEHLFGPRGACGGCWCMLWRTTRKAFEAGKGDRNRHAMKRIVDAGEAPGLLAYAGEAAIGWCALAPRERYSALARSRVMAPVDELPCWSVACLFVERRHRNAGVATGMLRAATEFARRQGAQILEGYPVEPRKGARIPPAFAWTGVPAAYERAGFHEVARRSPTRPIMRIALP